ncbi:hypothetical protein WDW37_19620 [Bdellovibrionota bacterium FG-1]
MNLSIRSYGTIFLSTLLAIFSGCSHGPAIQDLPDTASPKDEVTQLDTEINKALEAQVDVLSPYNFKHAQESLQDAKESLDKQKEKNLPRAVLLSPKGMFKIPMHTLLQIGMKLPKLKSVPMKA